MEGYNDNHHVWFDLFSPRDSLTVIQLAPFPNEHASYMIAI